MTAPAVVHPKLDYAGGSFGRPSPMLMTRSWRVQHAFLAPRDLLGTSSTLLGQDAINVAGLPSGLAVYAGYGYGTFDNWGALMSRFGSDALLVSITPVPEKTAPVMCLDIEPGNASPAAAPAFQVLPGHGGGAKPIYYCSAGDLQLVINALSAAGHARDSYFLWSAHWIGYHICGPSSCGYPQSDATQYASGATVDYDVWSESVLALPAPPASYPQLALGSRDPVAGANWVRKLQSRLDVWAKAVAPGAPELAVDGVFGSETETAVAAFQTMEKLTVDGKAGPQTWARVFSAPPAPGPPVPPPPANWSYPAPVGLKVVAAGHTTVKLSWTGPPLDGHPPVDHFVVWVYGPKGLVASYPRNVPGTVRVWEGGGMEAGVGYTAHVAASGPGTEHLGKDVFASASFKTG